MRAPNKLWAFGPPLSLLLLAFAYYVKVQSFREMVDQRFPWAKEHLGRFVPKPEVLVVKDEEKDTENPDGEATKRRIAVAPATPAPLTIEAFAANQALWPKTVKLRKSTEFPAVLNGKRVGKIMAPPGTEANLRLVQNQNLGLEFQGGGAWVPVSDTDLLERVKIVLPAADPPTLRQ